MSADVSEKKQRRGNCQCCAREQAVLNTDLMAKHGYTVEDGWFQGVCDGQNYAPMQIDRRQTDLVAQGIYLEVEKLRTLANRYESGQAHPERIPRTSRRPGQESTIVWSDASIIQRTDGIRMVIHALQSRARNGEQYAKMLVDLADRVHGQPLKEVAAAAAPSPIEVGEKRVAQNGQLLTCTQVVGARVYWRNERGFKSWTGSSAWRRLEQTQGDDPSQAPAPPSTQRPRPK